MFRGKMALPPAARLEQDLRYMRDRLGVDAIQFYDHNFFDREVDMVPLLEVLAKFQMPWWCFARSDALVNLSEKSWALVKKSRLRMAYIGAESPSDWLLHDIRKGTNTDQTLEAIEKCRSHGVIPELSFMLAPPRDPGGGDRENVRVHPPDQAVAPGNGGHELHLHAAAAATGRREPDFGAHGERASRLRRQARGLSANGG